MVHKILAVSSSGGHWEQLMLLRDSFVGHEVFYATTRPGLAERNGLAPAFLVADCNRDTPLTIIKAIAQITRIIRSVKPTVIVSTGAAPGIISIFLGRIFGAKTIWIDSIANFEKLSLSGKLAGYVANIHMTQWSHLSGDGGPTYAGSVL